MPLSRDVIYYRNFNDEQGNQYRLEMVPAKCTATGVTDPLPSGASRVAFPDDIILADLNLRCEYSENKSIPIGIPQRADLSLKFQLDTSIALHNEYAELIADPVLYSQYTDSPVFGLTPTRLFTRGVEFTRFLKHFTDPTTGQVTSTTYSTRSLSSSVILDVTEYTDTAGDKWWVFAVNASSPDAAFAIDINTNIEGILSEWRSTASYVIGAPSGYESMAIPKTFLYGNVWRVFSVDDEVTVAGITQIAPRMEGMQRRVPPVKRTYSQGNIVEFEITAVDVMRCALEATTLDAAAALLPTPTGYARIRSVCSAECDVFYTLRAGEQFFTNTIAELFEAIGKAVSITAARIRRATQTWSVFGPRHVKMYSYYESFPTVPLPSGGIDFEDCKFIRSIGGAWFAPRGGVLAPQSANAEESWLKQYGNVFDFLTDFASFTCSKYVIEYGTVGTNGVPVNFALRCYRVFAPTAGTTAVELSSTDAFLYNAELTHGHASVRGATAQVAQSHSDDKREYKQYIDNSERDDELSPKVLLHNIPSHSPDLIYHYMIDPVYSPTEEGWGLSEVVRIELGDGIAAGPTNRLVDPSTAAGKRDETVARYQYNMNFATQLTRVLTDVFATDALLTVKTKVFTSTTINTRRVGQLYNVALPHGRTVKMVMVSCTEDCVTGECEIELIGLDRMT